MSETAIIVREHSTDEQHKIRQTTCAYCGVGCGIEAQVNTITREITIRGDQQHPANHGRLCSKGSSLGETVGLNSRLLAPEVFGETSDWERALNTVAARFQATIEKHGPDSVAFYASGQLLTEDYYVANKLMKGFIGSANIDTNSRLCMSSAVAGHKRAFGSDTVPNSYKDLELAELVVLVGSNTAWCHPIAFQRIRAAKERNPNVKVVVIDPRRTQTCDIADLHLPIASGRDVTLFNGLLAYLAKHNGLDQEYIEQYTEGFELAVDAAKAECGDGEDNCKNIATQIAERCGLNSDNVETFFNWFLSTAKTVTVYSQGVKQSSAGVDKVNAILNCHLATGRIGKPGAGPFSMTGQPNAMGGREVGGLANQLAAHMDFSDPDDIDRVARFWQSDNIAKKPGYAAVDLFDAIYEGKVKAVWIMATNPVASLPNADKVKEALKKCPFVVVSDCVANTDTLDLADVKLPAVGWSEKDGTVTNSERRISHQRALLPPAGEAKPDWWIISEVGKRLGFEKAFSYQHPVEIFREHAALSAFENSADDGKIRDFNLSAYTDISTEAYDNLEPVQWPVTAECPEGRERFFADGEFFTPNRKGQFIALSYRAPGNPTDKQFPYILNTGRLRDQWHTMTRSALSPRLNQHRPEPFVEIHPADAELNQLEQGHIAHLRSKWGQMYARVHITEDQQQGNLFVPMHWTEQYATNGRMGALVNPVVDPISGQPESKHTPVAIRPFDAQWHGFILSRAALTTTVLAEQVEYQVTVNGDGYYRYELAAMQPRDSWQTWLEALLENSGLSEQSINADSLQWQQLYDPATGIYRTSAFNNGQLMFIACIAPQPEVDQLPERGWLSSMFSKEKITDEERLALLSGLPTVGSEDVGATICACFNVGEKSIIKAIQCHGLKSHQEVGKACKAGTNCGSCVPEIKAILKTFQ